MNDDQFTKLFNYMVKIDGRTERIEENMVTKEDHERLVNTLDNFMGRLDTSETEQAARDLQWERLLVWAREVSQKTGVPLPDL